VTLLVTGEGLEAALLRASSTLAATETSAKAVINLGAAGVLRDGIETGRIFRIRTVYGERRRGLAHQQSFTCRGAHEVCDIIAASERVLDDDHAAGLAPFAHLVDRESWGIAMAAASFGVPFQAVKITSDRAGAATLCWSVRESAFELSLRLWEYYRDHLAEAPSPATVSPATWSVPEGFHASWSQMQLLLSLGARETPTAALEQFKAATTSAKDRTRRWLDWLRRSRNPRAAAMEERTRQILGGLRRHGWAVDSDPELEDPALTLRARVETERDLERIRRGLDEFSLPEWRRFFEGDWR
jgi:hypothetical protein